MNPLRKTFVRLEDLVGVVPAWTDGSTWNGWARPLFDLQQVRQLVAAFAAVPELSEPGDCFLAIREEAGPAGSRVFVQEQGYPEYEELPVVRDGLTLWGIGASSWCWAEAWTSEDNDEHASAECSS